MNGEHVAGIFSPWPTTLCTAGQRLAYLGPPGTWTHQACLQWLEQAGVQPHPQLLPMDAPAALQALAHRAVDAVCLPVTTRLVGATPYLPAVLATLEAANAAVGAASGYRYLQVLGECRLELGYSLMARPSVTLAQLQAVCAHPVALQEAQPWLQRHLPGLAQKPLASAGAAAAAVAADQAQPLACLGPGLAAALHGLVVLHDGIEQGPHNETRWWLLAWAAPQDGALTDAHRPWLGRFSLVHDPSPVACSQGLLP